MGDIAELVDLMLTGQHPKLCSRCFVDRISAVLEDHFGAYDAAGVRTVLMDRRSEVDKKLAEVGAAPPLFLSVSLLDAHVNGSPAFATPAETLSSAAGSGTGASTDPARSEPMNRAAHRRPNQHRRRS